MADRLTKLVPVATPVKLGSRVFPVREARLSDLAAMQGWLDARAADPLDGLKDLPEEDGPERDRVLLDAMERVESGAPAYDSAEAARLFATPDGVAFFAGLALGLSDPDAVAGVFAAGDVTPDQYAGLRRAFFGVSPADEVRRLFGQPPPARRGRSITWGEAIDSLARSHGWTYETIYSLTLTEFLNARRHGEPEPEGFTGPPAWIEGAVARITAARASSPPGGRTG